MTDRQQTCVTWFLILACVALAIVGPWQLFILQRPSASGGPVSVMTISFIGLASACILYHRERQHRREIHEREQVFTLSGDDK